VTTASCTSPASSRKDRPEDEATKKTRMDITNPDRLDHIDQLLRSTSANVARIRTRVSALKSFDYQSAIRGPWSGCRKEKAMSQSHTRTQIVDYLVRHGSLEDPQGRATSRLREALGFVGSAASFTQLISTMDRAGELTREVKGKRTYRIAAIAAPALSDNDLEESDGPDTAEMDYDQVASALLVQVVQTLTQGRRGKESDGSWARRRIERLERRIDELERDLTYAKAESKGIGDERDELRLQLENSEGNLALLTDRLSTGKSREGRVSKLLGPDERALLQQLRSRASSERPGRAS
jgi:hypothetical protein